MANAVNETQNQFLKFIREGQQTALQTLSTWSEQAAGLVPDGIGAPSQQLTKQTSALVDRGFDFAEQLIAVQRDLVKGLVRLAPTQESGSKSSSSAK